MSMEPINHTIIEYRHAEKWPSGLKSSAEAASEIGISEARLLELTEAGYAPHWVIDNGPPMYRLQELRSWGARNLARMSAGRPLPVVLDITVESLPCNTAPRSIRDIAGLVEIPSAAEPGVYFLVKGSEVVYVGQTINPLARIGTHASSKDFDRVYMLPVPRELLDRVEGAMIRWLQPRLNGPTAPRTHEHDDDIMARLHPHRPQLLALNGVHP